MNVVNHPSELRLWGIRLSGETQHDGGAGRQRFSAYLKSLGLDRFVQSSGESSHGTPFSQFTVNEAFMRDFAPGCDTTQLCQKMGLDTHGVSEDLEREIVLAMLASPAPFLFPSCDELMSAVRIRKNIVQNARRTALAFDTEHAERPEDYWVYDLARGFTLKPGKPLIEALQKTTQPDRSGKLYSFSCYRATEYVLLLSIAQELAECNASVLAQLQQQWETRAIMSGQFHDVFLHEYGSMAEPLPPKYYVPGDRLWFRNPDEPSSNVEGYEGSWVFYLGDGLFTNFWKRDQPFTLRSKCVELFHWRNATYRNGDGKLLMDDAVVDEHVAQSLQDEAEVDRIVARMLRLRDPGGVYRDGGCIDTTRECARRVCAGTCELVFPG
ncbi:hypothetical protein [Pollutimonas bauzanensis]|uniref:hypothetical protein n=1 Tax=Pollutimonas bauzanensis TaxID=658167 RepID=UPI00333E4561